MTNRDPQWRKIAVDCDLVERPNLRRHRRGQSKRDIGGQRAMFTQRHGRVLYRGAIRHRDTQAMPGHALAGLWQSLRGMRRSHRPDMRAYAAVKLGGRTHTAVWLDEAVGVDW